MSTIGSNSGGNSGVTSNAGAKTETNNQSSVTAKPETQSDNTGAQKESTQLSGEGQNLAGGQEEAANTPSTAALADAFGDQPAQGLREALGDGVMKKGAEGAQVEALQTALNQQLGLSLGVDGKFGNDTKQAVRDFQSKHGLTADGIVGDDTREKLLGGAAPPTPEGAAEEGAKPEQTQPRSAAEYAALSEKLGEGTLEKGMRNDPAVEALQNTLNQKMGLDLKVDGDFGNGTKKAVEDFQRANGLPVNGELNPETRDALLGPRPPKTREQLQDDEAARQWAAAQPKQNLIFGDKLNESQQQKVRDVAAALGADPNDLMAVMAAETGGSLDPAQRAIGNPNGAVGLIQFTDTAIREMNKGVPKDQQISKSKLAAMGFEEQMDQVQSYMQTMMERYGGPANPDRGDLYAAVFSPALVDNSDTSTIYSKGSREYRANRSVDANRDGRITRAELTSRADDWYNLGMEGLNP